MNVGLVGLGVATASVGIGVTGASVGLEVTTVGKGEAPGVDGRCEGSGVGAPVGALEIVSVGCKVGEMVGELVASPVGLGVVGASVSPALHSVFPALTQSGMS
jgi:hypothetical protein